MTPLETQIEYAFRDPALLARALTHSSFYNENRKQSQGSNERLEFLGDAVLGMLTAEYLYTANPGLPEGELTKLRSHMVCEPSLCAVAASLTLGEHLQLGKGELAGGGRSRPSVLADAVEALLAAVYLDGGVEAARLFFNNHIKPVVSKQASFKDYKTQLQELVQRQPNRVIAYELVSEDGPDHAKVFTARVTVDGNVCGQGSGSSRKDAEQRAAAAAMEAGSWY